MYKNYYVNNNAQSNGDHEVHSEGCVYMPHDKRFLGNYTNCGEAVAEAKKYFRQSNGCKYCCPVCHTS